MLTIKLQNSSQKDWGTVYVSVVVVVVALGLRNIIKPKILNKFLLSCREQKSKYWSGAL